MTRALVVGGGLAGLGAALFLRKLGCEVAIIEKMPRVATLVRGFARGGLHFDTGFHYAGGLGGGILDRYLAALGVDRPLECVKLPGLGGEILRFDHPRLDFPIARGGGAFAASLDNAFPGTGRVVERFLADMSEFVKRSPYLHPETRTFDPAASYADGRTLAEYLDASDLPPSARSILAFRCLLYGARPGEAHFGEFALVNAPYIDHAATFAGGGAALALAFEKALAEAGVETRTNTEAVAVVLNTGNAVTAIDIASGDSGEIETLPCDVCVYCGHPAALPRLLPRGALRPIYAKRLLDLKETPKPFIIFAATRHDFFKHRQLFLFPDAGLDGWFSGQGTSGRDEGKAAVYVSGGEGRGGVYPVVAITCLPDVATADRRAIDEPTPEYKKFKERTGERVRRRLLEACPEFGGDLEIVDSATDATLSRWSFNAGGGIYGKCHGTASPPILPVTRIGKLALAGQSIILPGLLGVLVSAAVAVGFLLGHDRILKVLK